MRVCLRIRMDLMHPVPVRFSRDQLAWLDSQRHGPIVTRSEVLRHLVADAMERDRRRLKAVERRVLEGSRP